MVGEQLTAGVAEEHAHVVGGLAVGAGRAGLGGELHQEAHQHVGRGQAVPVLQQCRLTGHGELTSGHPTQTSETPVF